MKLKVVINKIRGYLDLFFEFINMNKVEIAFKCRDDKELDVCRNTFRNFTKPHRLLFFRHKTLGVCLIDLLKYGDFNDYYKTINGKNSAAYYSRKATSRGYRFVEINRNSRIEEIYDINTSAEERQGRKMDESYLKMTNSYLDLSNFRYYGIVNKDNRLLAYCDIAFYGGFAQISRLLGHSSFLNDGIMYLMLIEVARIMFEKYREKGYRYLMYDTYFGASEGLRLFKTKLGYCPFKVKWLWE